MEASSKASLAPATGRIWPKPRTTDGAAVPFSLSSLCCLLGDPEIGRLEEKRVHPGLPHALSDERCVAGGAPVFIYYLFYYFIVDQAGMWERGG